MNTKLRFILFLAVITGVALVLRCARLEERPMHNDEAVNAIKFGQLWEEGKYSYDPNEYHGPSLLYATLAIARLSSSPDFKHLSETKLRLVTVLFGLGLIVLLPLLADGLGKSACLWAGLLTAVSPAMVFYSRYYIHEMLLVFFALAALGAGWRYWRSRKVGWAVLAGAALGLMQATKETFVISVVAAVLALGINQLWNRWLDASGLPLKAPRLNYAHLTAALAGAVVVWLVLFSSFFTNASGPLDSFRTYADWFRRARGDSPHIHSWSFYFERLLFFHVSKGPIWSEALVAVLAMVGIVAAFARKGLGDGNASFVRFVGLYTMGLTVGYSFIGYKTPWCLLNFWQPALLLAGVGAAVLLGIARLQWARAVAATVLLAGAAQLGAQAWEASVPHAADRRNPYVYAQTLPDVLKLVRKVEALSDVSPQGREMVVKVFAPESDYWPLPWYLRQFDKTGWWGELTADPFAPVMIVSASFHANLDEKRTHLMVGYFELRPRVFFELYVEFELWKKYIATQRVGD